MIDEVQYGKSYDELISLSNSFLKDLVNHGFGNINITASRMKDGDIKVELDFGKTYVIFVKKSYNINNNII